MKDRYERIQSKPQRAPIFPLWVKSLCLLSHIISNHFLVKQVSYPFLLFEAHNQFIIHTMFSQAALRKSSSSIQRVLVASQRLNNSRPFFIQSRRSTSSSSSGFGHNDGESRGSGLNMSRRSVSSWFLVVGSSLGLCYCSSSSLNVNSFLSFADYRREEVDGDRFQQSETEKKPNFLFGGNMALVAYSWCSNDWTHCHVWFNLSSDPCSSMIETCSARILYCSLCGEEFL